MHHRVPGLRRSPPRAGLAPTLCAGSWPPVRSHWTPPAAPHVRGVRGRRPRISCALRRRMQGLWAARSPLWQLPRTLARSLRAAGLLLCASAAVAAPHSARHSRSSTSFTSSASAPSPLPPGPPPSGCSSRLAPWNPSLCVTAVPSLGLRITSRSTGPATAAVVSPACASRTIVSVRAYAVCLRRPVSSNVRPRLAASRQSVHTPRRGVSACWLHHHRCVLLQPPARLALRHHAPAAPYGCLGPSAHGVAGQRRCASPFCSCRAPGAPRASARPRQAPSALRSCGQA